MMVEYKRNSTEANTIHFMPILMNIKGRSMTETAINKNKKDDL